MPATSALPRFACPDWWDKLQAGETPMPEIPLDQKRAAKALAFFNRLRLPDVSGNPTFADACGDWFKDIVAAFFASEDPETGGALLWELLCMVPKKNSKSTYVAGLGLTALYMEDTPNRQMLLVGPSQNISQRCFEQAQGMVRLDPTLQALFQVQDHLKTIRRRKTGTKLEVKTFDTSIVTGEIPVLTIIDELHELGKKAKAAAVMQQIRGGGITKARGKLCMITTQSDEPPTGVWKTELDKARAIRDGTGGANPIMLPVLYEFPPEMQKQQDWWRDKRNWKLVLPNLGLSIDERALVDDFENNGTVSPQALQIWASQHLNIEIGVGLHGDRWSGAVFWEAAAMKGLTLDGIIDMSEVCTIGVDGGGMDDIASLGVIGRHRENGDWMFWQQSWCQPEVFARRKSIVPDLERFMACGDLIVHDSESEIGHDMEAICARLLEAGLLPDQHAIGYDKDGPATGLEEIDKNPDLASRITGVSQGYRMQRAVLQIPNKLKVGEFRHCGQPIMAWAAGNAKQELIGSNWLVKKQTAGASKIDPLMAAFNAAMLMFLNPVAASGATPWDRDPNYRLAV